MSLILVFLSSLVSTTFMRNLFLFGDSSKELKSVGDDVINNF